VSDQPVSKKDSIEKTNTWIDVITKPLLVFIAFVGTIWFGYHQRVFSYQNACAEQVKTVLSLAVEDKTTVNDLQRVADAGLVLCDTTYSSAGAFAIQSIVDNFKNKHTTIKPTEGWFALGYSDGNDNNFTSVGGDLLKDFKVDQLVKAKWSVNLRPAAADWSSTVGLVNGGECLKIAEINPRQAGTRTQIWARGTVVKDCKS
jgi:hypothetical protein